MAPGSHCHGPQDTQGRERESPEVSLFPPGSLDDNLELSLDLRRESTRQPQIYQNLIFSNLLIYFQYLNKVFLGWHFYVYEVFGKTLD